MCVYVCVCIYPYMCVFICVCICTYMYVYVCIGIRMYTKVLKVRLWTSPKLYKVIISCKITID